MYTPMFIHSIKYIIGRDYNECDKFNLAITNPCDIDDIKEKLRYFRLKNSLSQEDVAEYIGVDRTTYMSYENETRIYPIDIMHKMAKMYDIDVSLLLDDYHKFIYFGQGENIRRIRTELGLNQWELAEELGVSLRVIKTAEQEKVRFLKKNYIKLIDYYSENI